MAGRTATRQHILLVEDVERSEKDVIAQLLALPDGASCTIVINSGGGSVYAGLGIGTVIRAKNLKAHAVVLADCSSSALLVFAACETREVAEHSSFLFHPMQWNSDDRARVTGAKSWSREFARISDIAEEWLAALLPLDEATLRRWINQEKYVTAQEFFDLGLARPLRLSAAKVVSVTRRRKRATTTRASARMRKAS